MASRLTNTSAKYGLQSQKDSSSIQPIKPRDQTPNSGVKVIPSSEEMIGRVNQALGRWIGLKEVHFVRHLPTTVSGKITRKLLLVS
ncbi:hypothetical protein DS739_13670 (plasmid) [Acetobacter sp. JWB]|nr:hypothetical protein CPF11_13800 [Acetobacter pomorum]AXC27855.1 hypothetical protein DS739_13670 [Acetobacter sp. JWB]